jgi:hypothetical protein
MSKTVRSTRRVSSSVTGQDEGIVGEWDADLASQLDLDLPTLLKYGHRDIVNVYSPLLMALGGPEFPLPIEDRD